MPRGRERLNFYLVSKREVARGSPASHTNVRGLHFDQDNLNVIRGDPEAFEIFDDGAIEHPLYFDASSREHGYFDMREPLASPTRKRKSLRRMLDQPQNLVVLRRFQRRDDAIFDCFDEFAFARF